LSQLQKGRANIERMFLCPNLPYYFFKGRQYTLLFVTIEGTLSLNKLQELQQSC
jgi:hypothetical protein